MKILVILVCCTTFFSNYGRSQTTPATLPLWAPVETGNALYFFIPEANIFYDINKKLFIYEGRRSQLKFSKILPNHVQEDSLYVFYKVAISHPSPYLNFSNYTARYTGVAMPRTQQTLREQEIFSKLRQVSFAVLQPTAMQ